MGPTPMESSDPTKVGIFVGFSVNDPDPELDLTGTTDSPQALQERGAASIYLLVVVGG
jgi:hypothetical protein